MGHVKRLSSSLLLSLTQPLLLRAMATVTGTISRLVKVRSLQGEEKLNLILDDPHGHHREMLRDKHEHVGKALKRMVLQSMKSFKGGKRTRKLKGASEKTNADETPPISARLYTPTGELVKESVPNTVAWEEGSILELGSVRYKVCVNIPTILSVILPKFVMTGCPVVPKVTLEFADFSLCQWEWLRSPADHAPGPNHHQLLSTSHTYWPSELDSGYKLLLKCIPVTSDGRRGEAVTRLSAVVRESPKVTPITSRHLLTPARLAQADTFRVITYNTLASYFTEDDYARKHLYPYCDPTALDAGYRQGRLAHELIGYNANILSLQEVGNATYHDFLLPALRCKGYEGCFISKPGTISEGEAIFYDASRFSLVAKESTPISDFFEYDPSCSELRKGLASAPVFMEEVAKKHSIILVTLLRSVETPNNYLLVANTHLYYHPKGDHIRLVQVAVMVNYLRTMVEKFSQFLGGEARIATLLGGDLNSCPCIAAYDYLMNGFVGSDHEDWMGYKRKGIPRCQCYYKHNFGMESGADKTEVVDDNDLPPHIQFKLSQDVAAIASATVEDGFCGLELKHDFHFRNVTGTEHCTNYTVNFKAVLDYILIDSEHLVTDRVVPLPSLEEISEFVALPSVYFPSDHLALVVDIRWT